MKRIVLALGAAFVLLLSTALIYYGWWLFQIERGTRASLQGDTEAAANLYHWAEWPFRRAPWLAEILRTDYERLTLNQVALLYARGEMGKAAEKLEEAATVVPLVTESGEYAYWVGNLLLRRAAQSKDPQVQLESLQSALAEYQKGLTAQPDDWDLKYNYELVKHILSQGGRDRQGQQEKAKSILEKMRPTIDPSREEIPPEKLG